MSSDILEQNRISMLKKTIKRITDKREKVVLSKLVRLYRDGELTQEMSYSAIMLIAELRSAEGEIGKEDLW